MRSFQSRVVQNCPMAVASGKVPGQAGSGSLGQRRRVRAKSYCIMNHAGRKPRGLGLLTTSWNALLSSPKLHGLYDFSELTSARAKPFEPADLRPVSVPAAAIRWHAAPVWASPWSSWAPLRLWSDPQASSITVATTDIIAQRCLHHRST